MPAPIDVVDPVLPVRELEADEEYVMVAFERHASHCTRCADPLGARKEDRSLCERGHQYAVDVADYLYSKNGKSFSTLDRERNQPTLVKIPRDCRAVRALLLAIEDGLRLNRKEQGAVQPPRSPSPIITYDRNYPVPPRRSTSPQQQPVSYTEIIEREPRDAMRRRVIVYSSPRSSPSRSSPSRSSPSRGSLYESDAAERRRFRESSRIYRPTEYHR
ncbi:hypothetical protein BDV32DRAFT_118540 [Aspergillus pseudonomiae]|uniref:Uncharacterized protein n=1 Tax=Aspergillus pseudonomiae TaxID=1506151 RepID=A0A5N7DHV9_9EURO|nr:uncharacterized protein BDV37DRAFT_245881 [Aspergillus pseudonomiae]KAB8263855.1 hypothetical protein BDV32DRAFT_118540 [Aspergillus pseudonomiae]KAE8405158.1 hypothetical protein BDV37DRAFT_245881 [Aspergillus pseudonomiae]